MPNNVKTYDGTGDPEDQVKIFQAAAQVERWAMPTWCHMFNSTLIGAARVWFDELPPESIDGYKDLKAAFLAYFMQQKMYVKYPVEIYNIKQRDGETIEEFMELFKVETGRIKGAPECMRIFGFMHGGEAAAAGKKKGHISWRTQDQSNRHGSERRFDFLGKFNPPPLIVTPVEKRNSNKFHDFHNDKGHSTDECMQLKKQIEELVRAGKLSHLIKEIKQGRDQPKVGKKEVPAKDKSMEIYMIQPWHKMTRQKVTQSFERVSEITFPLLTTSSGTEGSLIIEAEIGGHMIHRMYVDGDSLTKALSNNRRCISFYKSMDEFHNRKVITHGMLKFPVDREIVTIRNTILILVECATVITSSKEIPKEVVVRHENFKVAIHPNFPDQEVAIRGTLSAKGRMELCSLLKKNLDIFVWQPSDMTGVPRSIAEHRLNIREGYSPVRQKKRGQAPERAKAIQAKVQKLVGAGIMREVYYHEWLSNPVMVKKHDGSWRMCVDFTDLNKVCPQDCYPLPEINRKVESLCGYPYKCFLDAYKGYHQIQMAESDEEKTSFYTSQGVYCYTKMPFGLKNTSAMYQRLVDKAFDSQVGRNIEVSGTSLQATKTALVRATPAGSTQTGGGNGSGAGLILISPKGTEFTYALRFQFTTSNNEAEYEALIAGIWIAAQMGVCNVQVSVDSKLVANQILGTYVAKEENMVNYLEKTKSLISGFSTFSISQVPRSQNKKADGHPLSKNRSSTSFAHLSKQVLVEILKEKSIQEKEVEAIVEEEGPTWMTPIIEYLKDGTLPGDRKEASKLRIKARQYELLEGVLYRRSFLQTAVFGGQAMHREYYWSSLHRDARDMIRAFGPFPEGLGKVKFLIVAMDYFTKWIEAKAVATITGNQVKKFVWDNIVCRFGLPGEIISDNGKQFSDNPFKDWCEKLNIAQRFASVKHPQSNGLVERANRSLGEGIKARLGEGNKNWIEELPHVLWAHRTMIKSSHGDTPFSLTYGTEAVIPAEIGMPTYRTAAVDAVHNDEELRLNLDLLEEKRECAAICEAKAKLKMTKYYNARVRGVTFRPGDFVYRSNDASHAVAGGKLGPKWEGPYEVTEALGDGAYRLRSMDGAVLPRTWNIANLKKCYL
ncbi:reverse transcriptase domain-containing protein [Tanacetum coccineum]